MLHLPWRGQCHLHSLTQVLVSSIGKSFRWTDFSSMLRYCWLRHVWPRLRCHWEGGWRSRSDCYQWFLFQMIQQMQQSSLQTQVWPSMTCPLQLLREFREYGFNFLPLQDTWPSGLDFRDTWLWWYLIHLERAVWILVGSLKEHVVSPIEWQRNQASMHKLFLSLVYLHCRARWTSF